MPPGWWLGCLWLICQVWASPELASKKKKGRKEQKKEGRDGGRRQGGNKEGDREKDSDSGSSGKGSSGLWLVTSCWKMSSRWFPHPRTENHAPGGDLCCVSDVWVVTSSISSIPGLCVQVSLSVGAQGKLISRWSKENTKDIFHALLLPKHTLSIDLKFTYVLQVMMRYE